MPTGKALRPLFFEGQFLGAEDLRTVVDYGRVRRARHALGAHTWGVAAGLEIVEAESPAGQVDVFVQPGYGWDGFGRGIIVPSPFSIPAGLFKDIAFNAALDGGDPAGRLVEIWLRYAEVDTRSPQPGFETCDPEGDFARAEETFRIEVGERRTHSERHDSVSVAGREIDASQVLQSLDPADPSAAPLLHDESISYQSLPLDEPSRRWLVPVGLVRWLPGSTATDPGEFVARTENDLLKSRQFRRYIGAVAESVEAPAGRIRLRDRFNDPGDSPESDDLVWVEGHLRVDDNLRLFGGRQEFLDNGGDNQGVPLELGRVEENGMGGRDLRVRIGAAEDGLNRLAVGPETDAGFKTRLVVLDQGAIGVGAEEPEHDLQVGDATKPVSLSLRGPDLNADGATLAFEDNAGQSSRWFQLGYDSDQNRLNLKSAEVDPIISFVRTTGRVGIGTTQPDQLLTLESSEEAFLNIKSNNGQQELRIGPDASGGLVGSETNHDLRLRAGSGRDVLLQADGNSTKMTVKANGRVGIGTSGPAQQLHVVGDRIRLQGGGKRLDMRTDGSAVDLQSTTSHLFLRSSGPGGNNNLILNPFSGDGKVGIGLQNPATKLHVAESRNQSADQVEAHVALIENTSTGSNADVLALKVGSSSPGESNNFITFFGGSNPVGRIERDSGSVVLKGTGSDYAEALPRLDPSEEMEAGDVVGVFAGRVSKQTRGADHLMVISDSPIVVGNSPQSNRDDQDNEFETVAFLGQVRLRVRGPVRPGDALLPSEKNDGTARALPPGQLRPETLSQVVATAWESSGDEGLKRIKALVGVTSCRHSHAVLSDLIDQVNELRKSLQVEVEE